MKKETIKKLIESSVNQDVRLGMAYLCQYINNNGLSDLNTTLDNMSSNCIGLIDFNPIDEEWNLAISYKNSFSINTACATKTGEQGFVVYRMGDKFKQVIENFKKEIIYEDE